MAKWDWLEKTPATWGFALRVVVKAAILFALCNVIYAAFDPLEALGRVSLYNTLLPGRERLPYGENFEQSYSLSLNNIPAMFASHVISRPKAEGEFRVVLIGDSGVWGWFLRNGETLAGAMNEPHPQPLSASREGSQSRDYVVSQFIRTQHTAPLQSGVELQIGQDRVVVYNLAYPIMSLTKDLLLLDEAMQYQPDMIVWLVTLESFPREKQLFPPLVQNNAARIRRLSDDYDLGFDGDVSELADSPHPRPLSLPYGTSVGRWARGENIGLSWAYWTFANDITDRNMPRLIDRNFFERTLVGQRRELADWLRLQLYGFSWATTGIDQYIPDEIPLRQSDFEADESWQNFDAPVTLTADDLAFDVLAAGIERAEKEGVPVVIVNEPIFISGGENSDLRYNSWYPRWVYDPYRDLLAQEVRANGWQYLDLWDSIDAAEFTDSPVHLTAAGTMALAEQIQAAMGLDDVVGELE
jgi:hypothetical protein